MLLSVPYPGKPHNATFWPHSTGLGRLPNCRVQYTSRKLAGRSLGNSLLAQHCWVLLLCCKVRVVHKAQLYSSDRHRQERTLTINSDAGYADLVLENVLTCKVPLCTLKVALIWSLYLFLFLILMFNSRRKVTLNSLSENWKYDCCSGWGAVNIFIQAFPLCCSWEWWSH